MKNIIPPVDRSILKSELTPDKFLRPTNKSGNSIYIITAHDSPNVMREIGRLRELSFRAGGGGTGEEIDTDKYDFMEKPYKQLIVWDPDSEEIIGGYRFISGADVKLDEDGQPTFVMSHLFNFNEKFIKEYMPYTIELGRAFVQPDYQTTKMGMKSLFALDNLWDGLGALIHSVKGAKYFIGKVTIYKNYPVVCRELIYEYLNKHFKDNENLILPKLPVQVSAKSKLFAKSVFTDVKSVDDYKLLNKAIRQEGENVPAMFNAYIGLTDTMKFFGSIKDDDFGSVYESGLMVIMDDLLETKKQRYIQPYVEYLRKMMDERRAARKLAKEEKLKLKLQKLKEREKKRRQKAKKRD
ncbi:MAG: hemolysin [Bacteroidales bacterium 36-12]|nr:MAG: hemolysin [Bacteroidales bacterium 36-12]